MSLMRLSPKTIPALSLGLLMALGIAACDGASTRSQGNSASAPVQEDVPQDRSSGTSVEVQIPDSLAEGYVRLVLAVGQHDADYVDAYYGPPEWRSEAEATKVPLEELAQQAADLLGRLPSVPPSETEASTPSLESLRRSYLQQQLGAVAARIDLLQGETLTFDEESLALYGAQAPRHPNSYFEDLQSALDAKLPGDGPLAARLNRFREGFVIPRDRLDDVFQAAIEACRDRTRAQLELPEEESFTIEYVRDKSWSAYNWYQGGYRSLIQVNEELPIHIDRALDLACHEGYPGHHVYNLLLEKNLVRDRGWVEFSVYPLFSPQSLIAEGSANFGIEVAFPGPERTAFERSVLFPLAGLDPARADEYYAVMDLVDGLGYAGNEAARRYLNGEIDAAQAAQWLATYALSSPERAAQRIRFFDQYRSYVINYNLGQDLVRAWVEAEGGTAHRPERRWEIFKLLLSTPRLPADIT